MSQDNIYHLAFEMCVIKVFWM